MVLYKRALRVGILRYIESWSSIKAGDMETLGGMGAMILMVIGAICSRF